MKNKKAFTLIELMVAMGVIAVLAGMSFVAIGIVQRSVRDTQRRDVVKSLELAIADYNNSNGQYPASGQITISTAVTPNVFAMAGVATTVQVKGATSQLASGSTSTSSGTVYCYYSNGASYKIGVSLEGGGWFETGNATTACQSRTNM